MRFLGPKPSHEKDLLNIGALQEADQYSGLPLYITGHSNAFGFGVTPSRRWPEIVQRNLRMETIVGAIPSAHIIENAFNMSNGSRWEYGTPRRGMAIVNAVGNSLGVLGDTANAHAMHDRAMRLVLADLSSSHRVQTGDVTTTSGGTWVGTNLTDTAVPSKFSGSTYAMSTSSGAWIQFNYTGKDAYVVLFVGAAGFATVEIKLDNNVVSGYSAYNLNQAFSNFSTIHHGASNTSMPTAIKIPVASSGAHTIRVTSTVAGFLFVDCLLVQHPTPQPIIVGLDPHLPAWNSTQHAQLDVYNTETAAIAAEFPNASTVDLRDLNAQLTYIDLAHYDDAGQEKVANKFTTAIRSAITANGAHLDTGSQDVTIGGADPHPLDSKISRMVRDVGSSIYQHFNNIFARKADIQLFTSNGTWTPPTGARAYEVFLIGGGGGGGSGRRGAAASVRCGGGGGGGGATEHKVVFALALNGNQTITIGSGGAGGNAVTANDTNGNQGGAGVITSISDPVIGIWARAQGGNQGLGGTNAAGTGGAGGIGSVGGSAGANASGTGGAGGTAVMSGNASGGGSGGGLTTGNAASAGGAGGVSSNVNLAGGTGGAINTAGGNGNTLGVYSADGGTGGGGGGSSVAGAGGAGGTGGSFGSGGGGGGASTNGQSSGAGGAGAPGVVLVVSYY